jgi:hypothetical protein
MAFRPSFDVAVKSPFMPAHRHFCEKEGAVRQQLPWKSVWDGEGEASKIKASQIPRNSSAH